METLSAAAGSWVPGPGLRCPPPSPGPGRGRCRGCRRQEGPALPSRTTAVCLRHTRCHLWALEGDEGSALELKAEPQVRIPAELAAWWLGHDLRLVLEPQL